MVNPFCYCTILYLIRIFQNLISICIIHGHNIRIVRPRHHTCRGKRVFTTKLKIYTIRLYGFFRYFGSCSACRSQITVHHFKFPFGYIGIRSKAVTRPCFVCLHLDAVSVERCRSPDMPAPKSGSTVFGSNHCITLGCFAQLEYNVTVLGIAYIVQSRRCSSLTGFPHKSGIGRSNPVIGRYHRSRIRNLCRSFRTVPPYSGLEAIPFIGIGGFHHVTIGGLCSCRTQIPTYQYTAVVHVCAFNGGIHCILRIAYHIEIGRTVTCTQIDGIRHIAGRTVLRCITALYQNVSSRGRSIPFVTVFPICQRIASRLVFRNIPGYGLGVVACIGCKLRSSRSGGCRLHVIEFLCHVHQPDGSHCKGIPGIRGSQVQTDFCHCTGQRDGKGRIVRIRVKIGFITTHRQVLSRTLTRRNLCCKFLEIGQCTAVCHLPDNITHICQHIHRTRTYSRSQ